MVDKRLQRGKSPNEILKERYEKLEFTGEWLKSIGHPCVTNSWLIWGYSGNGKSRFVMQLAKYLCTFGKVIYYALEENRTLTYQSLIHDCGMHEVNRRFLTLGAESLEQMKERLNRRNSAQFVIIDSLQYFASGSNFTKDDYFELLQMFPKKMFIFISHAEGKKPEGAFANKTIYFQSDVCIHVSMYKAMVAKTRYGGDGSDLIVWHKGVKDIC